MKKAAAPQVAKKPAGLDLTPDADGFIAAGKGYALGFKDGKLVCRNPKGAVLASVPKEVKDGEVAERLGALREYLAAHERECELLIEGWLLRSLPVPIEVLTSVWRDAAYRRALENIVAVRVDAEGKPDANSAGFLKGVDRKKGIGLVTLDGETKWETAPAFMIPHPILLPELDDYRSLAAELSFTQIAKQLFREVFRLPADTKDDDTEVGTFKNGKFEEAMHARGAAKSLGYRCSGGVVTTRIYEGKTTYEARYSIGDEDDDYGEVYTDGLSWTTPDGEVVPLKRVPPIAFSEGMRMASAVYGKRAVEKAEDANA